MICRIIVLICLAKQKAFLRHRRIWAHWSRTLSMIERPINFAQRCLIFVYMVLNLIVFASDKLRRILTVDASRKCRHYGIRIANTVNIPEGREIQRIGDEVAEWRSRLRRDGRIFPQMQFVGWISWLARKPTNRSGHCVQLFCPSLIDRV